MRTIILSFLIIFTISLAGQPLPEKEPADPDYHISQDELREMETNGIVLPPIKPLYDRYKNFSYEINRDLPQVYDLRDSAYLTPVKSQSAGGCWAYSTMGTVECRLQMLGYPEYNLSDNNLKFCHGYIPSRNTNGNHWMSSAYFARRSGPYLESEDPYPGGTNSNDNCPTDFSALYYINESRYPPPQNINYIKQTVLNYGPVWSLLMWNDAYYNSTDFTYYYTGNSVNHAGVIVGWNDTLSTAGGSGAWIVRNTWGQGFGESGYYYISFNDSQFGKYNGYWPEVIENETGIHIYQYDEIGGYWGVGFNSEVGYGLVKFEGTDRDTEITKIGSFIVSTNCGVEIKIFDHFQDSVYGLLGSMDETLLELSGYYTFDLDSAILIPAGEDFYVQIRYDSNDPGDVWPIAVEDTITQYAMPELESGKCWIAPDPSLWPTYWYQVGLGTPYHYDLCIKAYAHERFNISGTLIYDDSLNTKVENAKIYLLDESLCRIDSVVSGIDGVFGFSVKSGEYQFEIGEGFEWGGVNATDALATALHYNNIPDFTLNGLALLAADVNGDNLIDSLDANLIENRTIQIINTFSASDFIFEDNSINVDGTDVSKELRFLCRGDVNASRAILGK